MLTRPFEPGQRDWRPSAKPAWADAWSTWAAPIPMRPFGKSRNTIGEKCCHRVEPISKQIPRSWLNHSRFGQLFFVPKGKLFHGNRSNKRETTYIEIDWRLLECQEEMGKS